MLKSAKNGCTASEAELLEQMRGLLPTETAQLLGNEPLDDMMV